VYRFFCAPGLNLRAERSQNLILAGSALNFRSIVAARTAATAGVQLQAGNLPDYCVAAHANFARDLGRRETSPNPTFQ